MTTLVLPRVLSLLSRLLAILAVTAGCGGLEDLAKDPVTGADPENPSPADLSLELVAFAPGESPATAGDSGAIQLSLQGNTRVEVAPGEFGVTDPDAMDGVGGFLLPNPAGDGETRYTVLLRPESALSACAGDCDTGNVVAITGSDPEAAVNVAHDLLVVRVDVDGDGTAERHDLFADDMEAILWSAGSAGERHALVRFELRAPPE